MNPRDIHPGWCALRWAALLAVFLINHPAPAPAAEAPALRLAVGPFFAPSGNEALRKTAVELPDLLTVELSKDSRFQLVEREQVQSAIKELKLNAAGLSSSDTVAKLGRFISADRLVSGSFVTTGTRTQLWTKVIDLHTGIVLDLSAVACEPADLTATMAGVAKFVASAGTGGRQHEFVALGRFQDFSTGAQKQDWSRRLQAAVERHFHAAGFGVVEREAVSSLLQEFELDSAGLTRKTNASAKAQSAFWLVDGGCEWAGAAQDRLNVVVRVQKVGFKETVERFTAAPGDGLEKTVVQTVLRARAATNLIALNAARGGESAIHTGRGDEGARRRNSLAPTEHFTTGTAEEQNRKREENRDATLRSYEAALLLDSKNLNAKYMLAYGRISKGGDERERGRESLIEMADGPDMSYADRALGALSSSEWNKNGVANPPALTALLKLSYEARQSADTNAATFRLGASLLASPCLWDRRRGTNYLKRLAGGTDKALAEKARGQLLGRNPVKLEELLGLPPEAKAAEQLLARYNVKEPAPPPAPVNWSALQAAVNANPVDLKARFNLASALLTSPSGTDRGRGAKLMKEVAAGDDPDLAERASKLLPAEPGPSASTGPASETSSK